MVTQDTWPLLKASFSINSPQIFFPLFLSVLKIIREVKTSANLKIFSLCYPTTTLPPPPLPKPTTPDKEAHPNPNTCIIVICWSSLCHRTGNKRNEGRWIIVCGEVFVQAFQLGALFYWNPYQIHQFPFQIDLSTFDKIVIFGVSEMVNVFNNTSVPINFSRMCIAPHFQAF